MADQVGIFGGGKKCHKKKCQPHQPKNDTPYQPKPEIKQDKGCLKAMLKQLIELLTKFLSGGNKEPQVQPQPSPAPNIASAPPSAKPATIAPQPITESQPAVVDNKTVSNKEGNSSSQSTNSANNDSFFKKFGDMILNFLGSQLQKLVS
jgi:hypothetical protein